MRSLPFEWVVASSWLIVAGLTLSSPPTFAMALVAAAGFAVAGIFKLLRARRER
jgi:hypothetical protein